MYRHRITRVLVAAALLAASSSALGQSPANKKPLAKMTCEDFVGLEDSFRPKAVYWAIAYSDDGKPESAGVNVEGIEKIVPVVTEACKKTPKESFWQRVKAEFKKIEKKL